ncbi:MAG: phenylalanine--tRNA ligase subunit beta [Clostridia bacterium]
MKTTLNWLRDYCDIDVSVEELCARLVNAGFEVEEVKYLGEGFSNVVVGKITKISKHPDADKLQICELDVGDEILQIVTGATNVQVGDVVPVAKHNSTLPCGKHITKGKLRGVESCGMLCGGEEMCINNSVYPNAEFDGIAQLNKDEQIGQDIVKVLGLDDYLLDISITPNRPDCGSIYGIAREIAVILNKPLKPIDVSFTPSIDKCACEYVDVKVQSPELCPNYTLSVVDNCIIEPSPMWLTRRLFALGLRSINNYVDITNYVLMELGQPMHAFDYADLTDHTIIVRRANEGEKIIPLDNKEYALTKECLVIADKNRAIGLAGIMGGANSGIKPTTARVAFESVVFSKENIRKNSKMLGIHSDSSARYEKGIDDFTSLLATNRALHLIEQLNCGKIVKGQVHIGNYSTKRKLTFNYDEFERILGIIIPQEAIIDILNRLNISTTIVNGVVDCLIPEYRQDVSLPCDIIEDVIRLYGYDKLTSTLLNGTNITFGGKTTDRVVADKIKNILIGLGFNETITYSFGGKQLFDKLSLTKNADLTKNIRIINPLGEEFSIMRSTLDANMLDIFSTNALKGNFDLSLFEYGKVYIPKSLPLEELPYEIKQLCFAVTANDGFYVVKDICLEILASLGVDIDKLVLKASKVEHLHPNISCEVYYDDILLAYCGQVHPTVLDNFDLKEVAIANLNITNILNFYSTAIKYRTISKFPAIDRDFALVVEEKVTAKEIIDIIKNSCKHCESVNVFDVYKGAQIEKGKKSVALSVKFRGEKTLQESDIEHEINKCLSILKDKVGATLR